MDVETYKVGDKIKPYLIAWYDGKIKKSYFINDYPSYDALVLQVMNDLSKKKYRNHRIYLHNLSKFDSTFLLTPLCNIENASVKPKENKGKLISIKFKYKHVLLHLYDSYLLLPASLRKLGVSFNNNGRKDYFPILFNDINYSGVVPAFTYFVDTSQDQYNSYCKRFNKKIWDFKTESIKYCLMDCIALFNILNKFNDLIFNKFKLNMTDYPTLPSLTFANYRANYMPENTIAGLNGVIYEDIKQSYTGGAVDMYKPSNNKDELIYAYDVNSLYPFVMKTFDMPVGIPTYFSGDISLLKDENPFGFFMCDVEAPMNIKQPIIQLHLKSKEGVSTVSPVGNFEMILFSQEMLNAEKYGYKFKIKWGYLFDRKNIFKEIINELYSIRINFPKSDPMNYISKILMNALYGRWGMSNQFNNTNVISKKDYPSYEDKHINNIVDVLDLDKNFMVTCKQDMENILLDNGTINSNINIAIASAITAYARIHMSQFKNNPEYTLYYVDTDGIYINKPLSDHLVSDKELGLMKLEHVCDKAIFIAPKVYGLHTKDGDTILKVKGLKKESIESLKLADLESLLIKDNKLEVVNSKWYKDILNANITIKDQLYTIKATQNKRILVYADNKLVNTSPFIIGEENN
jgi:hypothetical protein